MYIIFIFINTFLFLWRLFIKFLIFFFLIGSIVKMLQLLLTGKIFTIIKSQYNKYLILKKKNNLTNKHILINFFLTCFSLTPLIIFYPFVFFYNLLSLSFFFFFFNKILFFFLINKTIFIKPSPSFIKKCESMLFFQVENSFLMLFYYIPILYVFFNFNVMIYFFKNNLKNNLNLYDIGKYFFILFLFRIPYWLVKHLITLWCDVFFYLCSRDGRFGNEIIICRKHYSILHRVMFALIKNSIKSLIFSRFSFYLLHFIKNNLNFIQHKQSIPIYKLENRGFFLC